MVRSDLEPEQQERWGCTAEPEERGAGLEGRWGSVLVLAHGSWMSESGAQGEVRAGAINLSAAYRWHLKSESGRDHEGREDRWRKERSLSPGSFCIAAHTDEQEAATATETSASEGTGHPGEYRSGPSRGFSSEVVSDHDQSGLRGVTEADV